MKITVRACLLVLLLAAGVFLCAGCGKAPGAARSGVRLTQAQAVAEVARLRPDFPAQAGKTVEKRQPVGGSSGSTALVKYRTDVSQSASNACTVTLTKDWGFSVGGTYVSSWWKYRVTSDRVVLIGSEDNDKLASRKK